MRVLLISLTKVNKGLARTSWFGRIQKLNDGKIFNLRKNVTVIDGSHNQDGAVVIEKYDLSLLLILYTVWHLFVVYRKHTRLPYFYQTPASF